MAKKVNISFKDNELEMYEYLMSKISASYFIKMLIQKEMEAEKQAKKPTQKEE